MKRNLKHIITILFIVVLVVMLLPATVFAAKTYVINGVSVRYDSFSSSKNECWTYANNLYKKIWGENFNNTFNDDNSLRNLSDKDITLTQEHLKKYVSNAKLGACLRICNSDYLYGSDGWGHSQIIVQKDSNGFTVLEGGLTDYPYCREKYYTWSEYCNTGWLGGTYDYIKYIKWPNASPIQTSSPSGPLPSNFKVTLDKSSYQLGDTVTISTSASNAIHYDMSVWYGGWNTGEFIKGYYKFTTAQKFTPDKPGEYTLRVDANGSSDYISTEKTFVVYPAPTKFLSVQQYYDLNPYSIFKIQWVKCEGADGYIVQRKIESEKWCEIAYIENTDACLYEYYDEFISPGSKYTYRVLPYIKVSTITYANYNNAETEYKHCTPSMPSNLKGFVSDGIVLTWDDVPLASYYLIQRSTDENGTYATIGDSAYSNYWDTDYEPGETYYYMVKAYTLSKEEFCIFGPNSNVISVKVPPLKLAAPNDLKVTKNSNTGKPELSWKPVSGAAKYEVYRATNQDGTYSRLTTTTGTKVTNTSATAGKKYYYKVRAVNSTGEKSAFSAVKSVACDCAQPVLTVSTSTSSGKPVLKWDKVSGAAKYEIYRKTGSSGSYSKLATTSKTSYTNTSAVPGRKYYYKVKAICERSSYGNSAYSSAKSVYCDCAKPALTVSTSTSSGKPVLKWKAIEGAEKYAIYRKTGSSGSYSKIATTSKTSYTNTSAVPGRKYYYKVKAICERSSYGNSAYSSTKSAYCDCARPTVSIKLKSNKPYLTWNKVTGASKYEVYRATSKTGKYTKISTTTGTVCKNTSATKGKTYYYKVKAICGKSSYGNSAYSPVKYIKSK